MKPWQLTLVICILAIILGFVIGFNVKKCPEIKTETTTVTDSITVHDTLRDTVPSNKFIVKREKDTIYTDSSKTKKLIDSTNCYSFDKTEPDGAYIKAEMCSKELPIEKPVDLKGKITYQAAADTNKSYYRVDTVTKKIEVPQPFFKDWKTYTIAGLVALVAALLNSGH